MPALGLLKNGRLNNCFHIRSDGTEVEFSLQTDPPEAIFWTTYKLKKSDIKINGFGRTEAATIRQEILDNIEQTEITHKEKYDANYSSPPKIIGNSPIKRRI